MEAKRARARVASYICMHASIHELICDHLCVHQCLKTMDGPAIFIFVSYNYYTLHGDPSYICMHVRAKNRNSYRDFETTQYLELNLFQICTLDN